jgi:signal transduction histidine kinase
MIRMLDDDAFASACTAKGVLRARQFSWNRTARLVYDVYQAARMDRQSGGGARGR